jgi:HPt (histidine-containing phosphotransfer) domain-containing protein
MVAGRHNRIVQPGYAVLDTEQLRDVTMDDEDLMRQVLWALVDDTARQVELLEIAIREGNSQKCIRLAHYSKGACASIGANRAAGIFKQIETNAAEGQFHECGESLAGLARELDQLRSAAQTLQ